MKKRPSSKETIRRGFSILSYMEPNVSLTSRRIYQKLVDDGYDVSQRTVERDLRELPDMFPNQILVIDRMKPFGYRLPSNHRKYSGMSPSEAVCLQLAVDYLNPLLPSRTLDPISPYLKEAEMVLKQKSATKMKRWKSKVLTQYEGLQLEPAKIDRQILNDIHIALWNGSSIKVLYLSKNSKTPKEYFIHPGGLVYRGRVSYLVGSFDGNADNLIYLPLHRFKKVSVLEEYSVHRNADIRKLSEELLGFKVNPDKVKVLLKFTRFAGTHLYESPLSSRQQITESKDGYLLVEDTVTDDMELRFWIRGFGDEVEVIRPKSLRLEFIQMSKRMSEKYEED